MKEKGQELGCTVFELLPEMDVNAVQHKVVKHHGKDVPVSI